MKHSLLTKAILMTALLCLVFTVTSPAVFAEGAVINGTVFEDSNRNGFMDQGERTIEGAEVTLIAVSASTESIVNQVQSGSDGAFRFTSLNAGDYYLQARLPDNLYITAPAVGGSEFLPAQGQNSRTPIFNLAENGEANKFLGAVKPNGTLELIAFGDLNMNGGRMSNEPRIRDVHVEVLFDYEGQTYVVAEGNTDRDGEVILRDLTQTTYRIKVTMPEPYIIGPLGQKINRFYNIIVPSENNIGTSEPFTLERNLGLGIGGVKAGTLQGTIWHDADMDGKQSSSEGGISGIKLVLSHLSLGVTRELITSDDGTYTFVHLQAGEYSLRAELPENLMFAIPGSPSIFQDGYSSTQEMNVQVTEDGITKVQSIGVMPASSLTLTAFHDSNIDGLAQEGEPAFTGALVEIMLNGSSIASATTDSQGIARLPRVRHGEVNIRVSLPDGQVFTVAGLENGNAFHSINALSQQTISRTLSSGEHLSLYAGATLPASVSGILFEDMNQSSVLDNGEVGLSGFIVQAIDQAGNIAAEGTTGETGAYTLENLVPASYKIRFNLVSPYIFSAPSVAGRENENKVVEQTREYGQTDTLELKAGMLLEGVDAGAFRSAVVNGAILLGDEVAGFDGNLGGLEGVYVELLDENGQQVSEYTNATTDAQGFFSLKGALPGTYSLAYRLPQHAKFSRPYTDEPLIQSARLTLKASDEVTLEPLFAVKTGIIAGQAFHDLNADGSYRQEETPLANIKLTMVGVDIQETYQVSSNETGQYTLEGIRPGNYTIHVKAPEGYLIDLGQAALVPASVLGISEKNLLVEMGGRIEGTLIPLVKPVVVSGVAYYDNDLDKAFNEQTDTIKQQSLSLTHIKTGTSFTLEADALGSFTSEGIFPGDYSVSLTLPEDHLVYAPDSVKKDETNWEFPLRLPEGQAALEIGLVQLGSMSGQLWNMDGSGKDVSGLTIKLLNTNGELLDETQTDESGAYSFKNLYPKDYILEANLPEIYRFARELDTQERMSAILSDLVGADKNQGRSEPIKLNMGEQKTATDIGMGAMGSLGDYAWLDLDKDGMQDAGEPGIPGLVITLYQYGQKTAEATTDEYGRYLFRNLFPGTYTMTVLMPQEIKPTLQQKEFLLVASVLKPTEETTANAEGLVVPSGRRNLNADLGFVLRQDGRYPESLKNLPTKDWTSVNEQDPKR